ncbi:uncharacterized protein LOC109859509 [Pseudomyrmex gracilis]|uniref:uncharacterized protein LOC109859509 n=1 Tax=Pseudomyrmex gracilis TaxID=219809 RepID=UPI000994DA1D|nr:uncharacterized protein LOC109859509 [Pseudomyrmex gracilis]
MAGQIQIAFLLAVIAVTYADIPSFSSVEGKWVNIDKAVDELLPFIRKFILNNGLDPTPLVDFSEYIFPKLPGKSKGNIDFKNGWLQNLSRLKRSNNVHAIYKNKRLTLDMNVGFDVLDFNYEYSLQHLLYKRQGDVYGRFYDLDVNVNIELDLENYYINLNSLNFSAIRKFDIKFEGNLLDRIVNALTKMVTKVFRKCVLVGIEDRAMLILGVKIAEWNEQLPRPDRIKLIEEWLKSAE